MSEAEWLTCTDPHRLIQFAPDRRSQWKWLLFAAACARRAWDAVSDEDFPALARLEAEVTPGRGEALRVAIEVGQALNRADFVRRGAFLMDFNRSLSRMSLVGTVSDIVLLARLVRCRRTDRTVKSQRHQERRMQRRLMLDIFGNPFRPVTVDPIWRAANDGAALNLARAIEAENNFRRLHILADALEDAGCANDDILDHCRNKGTHVRGCWVVGLILGRA